jgi:nucleobase:cation symporter-1, NCS1 family
MEYSAFEQVPQKARTFTFWDQAIAWFSSCSIPAAWYYGALMAGWEGIIGSLLLIFIASTLSLIPWSYLGRIASETGGSSMAIVRPTFGIRGALIPSFFYIVFGVGWAVVNVFLGAISLSYILNSLFGFPTYLAPHNTIYMIIYILIVCLLQSLFAIKGHRGIKLLQRIATILFVILGLYQTYVVLTHWNFISLLSWKPAKTLTFSTGPFNFPITFPLLLDLLIAYNWTWEFIGDFSRFAKDKNAGTWGPFLGANISQYWWFLVGAFAVVYLSETTHAYSPLLADPSSTTVSLGLGWIAALVILFATITSNAGNIYASSLGISNIISFKKNIKLNKLLVWSSLIVILFSLTPLLSSQFVGFYLFFLDFLGAIVVPLWTITLTDYFFVKKQNYTKDIFNKTGGAYWYHKGWNWHAIIIMFLGVALYWIIAYAFPTVRETISAAIPTMLFVSIAYTLTAKKVKTGKS